MTNPSAEIRKKALDFREELRPFKNLVSVHVRTGGSLADTREKAVANPKSRFRYIYSTINNIASKIANPFKLYLTTDSTVFEEFLRSRYPPYRLVTIDYYKRGHTSGKHASEKTIKRSLLDMYIAAQAKTLIYTRRSGFSLTILYLGEYDSNWELSSKF